jgi:hypothetical protein
VLGTECLAQDIGTGSAQGTETQGVGFRSYLAALAKERPLVRVGDSQASCAAL